MKRGICLNLGRILRSSGPRIVACHDDADCRTGIAAMRHVMMLRIVALALRQCGIKHTNGHTLAGAACAGKSIPYAISRYGDKTWGWQGNT